MPALTLTIHHGRERASTIQPTGGERMTAHMSACQLYGVVLPVGEYIM